MNLKTYFGDYKKSNINQLEDYMNLFEKKLKKFYNFENPFFKSEVEIIYKNYLEKCDLNYESMTPEKIFDYISPLFQSLPNWNNPGTMINVIPPVNLTAMTTSCFSILYNSNFAQDTYAGFLIVSELEVVKYISNLIGWKWLKSAGVFTFGGTGTSLYATKVALNKADLNNKKDGCEKKYFIVTSAVGHPCHYQVCDWLGIGTNNCIEIPCDEKEIISCEKAEKIISKKIEDGYLFLGYNLNGGSTNELNIDPVREIYDMNLRIIKKYKLNYIPHIHVDTVLGWVFLFFNKYDYNKNPLNIKKEHLRKIKNLNRKIKTIKYADSIGVDFHKTGFCPYISSLVVFKNKDDYNTLNPEKKVNLEELKYGNFNPFETTLELSRSSLGPVSALTSLKSLGIVGFQKIISNIFSSTQYFKEELSKNDDLCVINNETEGFATFFIIKPLKYKLLKLEEILKLSQKDIDYIREYNIKYSKYILDECKKNKISFIFTSSRSYKISGTNIKLGAIKSYPMSPFLDNNEITRIIKEIFITIQSYKDIAHEVELESNISDNMVYREDLNHNK